MIILFTFDHLYQVSKNTENETGDTTIPIMVKAMIKALDSNYSGLEA